MKVDMCECGLCNIKNIYLIDCNNSRQIKHYRYAQKITCAFYLNMLSNFLLLPFMTKLRSLWEAVGFQTTIFWSREPVANREESGDQSTHVALAEWVGSLNNSCKEENRHPNHCHLVKKTTNLYTNNWRMLIHGITEQ